jgi:hypothetical protein
MNIRSIPLAALAIFPIAALGAELQLQCPERHLSKPFELAEVAKGWSGAVTQVLPGARLSGGGMVGGSLKLQPPADLRGNDLPTRSGWSETRYPVDGESWAYCSYGQGGEIRLYRRVDAPGVHECSVRSLQPKAPAALKVEVTCK